MCGVAGIIGPVSPRAFAAMERALSKLHHRGPDGRDLWSDDRSVVLGATRLAIVDPEGGSQPFVTRSGDTILVFNGELYETDLLRARLEDAGAVLRTHSDTELAGELLERHGPAALEGARGIFAYLAWSRSRGELWLGRDPLGVKPLYLAEGEGVSALASEIGGLEELLSKRLRRDEAGLLEYVHFQQTLSERTMFEGVRRILPGLYRLHEGRLRRVGGEDLLAFGSGAGRAQGDGLPELFEATVRSQRPLEVSWGVALSGGLDSSVVAALARPAPHAYTGRFQGGEAFDETPFAVPFSEQVAYRSIVVTGDAEAIRDDFDAVIRALDEPAAGPGALALWMLYREVGQRDRVLLSGLGGDELFGGYARHLLAWGEQRWNEGIHFSSNGQVSADSVKRWPELAQLDGYRPLWERFRGGGADAREGYWRLLLRSGPLLSGLRPEWRRRAKDLGIEESARARFDELTRVDLLSGVLGFEAETSLQALLHVEDRISMAHSVEARVPLLDPGIVRSVLAIDPRERMKDGRLKGLLREVARPWVPASIVERRDKMGFPVPLSSWAKGPWRGFLSERLQSRGARVRELFEDEVIESAITGDTIHARELWCLLCLESWLRARE
ncbi:MAG: asparagine synthase (glutamine-hydrolyzing) [Planctomycetota bacterium]